MAISQIWNLTKEAVSLPFKYKKSIGYMLKKYGIKGLYDYLFVKYNVADEGGEMALLNYFYRTFPDMTPVPYKIEMEHTTQCDKKCIFCEHTYWKNEKKERINFEQYKSVIDQFPGLRWINITGEGSGFLNPDFMEMIKYSRSKGISVNFVDEMEFIDEEKARQLIEYGVNCIWVSMDGATKETYEKVKVGCNYDKVIENIKILTRLKKELNSPFPYLCFRFIASTINYHEIPMMPKLLHDMDCLSEGSRLEYVGVLKFKEIEKYHIKEIPADLKEKAICEAEKYNMPVFFSHTDEEKLPDLCKCTAWIEPYIMMGGYVVPCCAVMMSNKREFLRKNALGNVREQTIEEIWNSERYKKMRKLIPQTEGEVPILCAGCRAYNTKPREEKYGISKEI